MGPVVPWRYTPLVHTCKDASVQRIYVYGLPLDHIPPPLNPFYQCLLFILVQSHQGHSRDNILLGRAPNTYLFDFSFAPSCCSRSQSSSHFKNFVLYILCSCFTFLMKSKFNHLINVHLATIAILLVFIQFCIRFNWINNGIERDFLTFMSLLYS